MISEERLKWLNDNKIRGDIAKTVQQLNKNKISITYQEAASIMNGRLWGEFGKIFTDTLEEIINVRISLLKKEAKKYAK